MINVARKWQQGTSLKRPPFNHPIYKDAVMEEFGLVAKWNPLAFKLLMWVMGVLIVMGSGLGFNW